MEIKALQSANLFIDGCSEGHMVICAVFLTHIGQEPTMHVSASGYDETLVIKSQIREKVRTILLHAMLTESYQVKQTAGH